MQLSSAIYKYLPWRTISLAAARWRWLARSSILAENPTMPNSVSNSATSIRNLTTIEELEAVLRLEKEVWGFEDADVTPLTLAVAMKATGSIWLGAFKKDAMVGFAFAFPSLEEGKVGFHSHTLAVHPAFDNLGLGYQLKLAQRDRVLARGIAEITWTFDPLRMVLIACGSHGAWQTLELKSVLKGEVAGRRHSTRWLCLNRWSGLMATVIRPRQICARHSLASELPSRSPATSARWRAVILAAPINGGSRPAGLSRRRSMRDLQSPSFAVRSADNRARERICWKD